MASGCSRTVLFAVGLAVVCLTARGSGRKKPCLAQPYPYRVWSGFKICALTSISELPSLATLRGGEMTKASLVQIAEDICTISVAAGKECVEGMVPYCTEAAQNSFKSAIASGVGYLCRPDGAGIDPAWQIVFDSITDEDIAQAVGNSGTGCPWDILVPFYQDMSEAMGGAREAPLDSMISIYQRALDEAFNFILTKFRAAKDRCRPWKVNAILGADKVLEPYMGVRIPYTAEQMAAMFEISTE